MADRVIVATFDTQNQAYDAARAVQNLSEAGAVTLKRAAIVSKDARGNLSIPDTRNIGRAWGLLGGTVIGGLLGALLGPVGVAAGAAGAAAAVGATVGATTGATVGATTDLLALGMSASFIDTVSYDLQPGNSALIAEIEEGSTEPIDSAVSKNGGRIYRENLG